MSEVQQKVLPLARSSVLAAHDQIKSRIHCTPIFTSSSLSAGISGGNTIYFKAENLQKCGAFKFRGASFSLSRLTPEELDRGVCTHSSGLFAIMSISQLFNMHWITQEIMQGHWPWLLKNEALNALLSW